MKVLFLEQVDSASGYYRTIIPNNELVKHRLCQPMTLSALRNKYGNNHTQFHKKCEFYFKLADVMVIQLTSQIETEIFFDYANYANVPVLIEVDDLVEKTTEWIDITSCNRPKNVWLDRVKLWSKSDGFITSTQYLADHYSKKFSKPGYVSMNQLDFDDYRWNVEVETDPAKVVIGFMGSDSHRPDLLTVKSVLTRILEEYPNVEVNITGLSFNWKHDRVKFITNKKKDKLPGQGDFFELDDYPSYMNFDIGIIPLVDEDFNRAKSDLKFLEYGRLKIPTVAQKIPTYHTVCDGKTGLLAGNDKEWYRQLVKLIEKPKRRQDIGQAAFEYVRDRRNISQHIGKYVSILETAIRKKGTKKRPGSIEIIKGGRLYGG